MKILLNFIIIVPVLLLSACSPKQKLTGTWRASMDGENRLILKADGTASAQIDVATGLLGRVRGESTGTWTPLKDSQLLLELETNGVRTSETSRYELSDGDLILINIKTGQSLRYKKDKSPDAATYSGKEAKSDTSKDAKIISNLRWIKSGGEQYMLENGTDSATYAQAARLLGGTPESQFGESYDALVIVRDKPLILTVRGKTYKAE